jgi:hypothetical protein
MLFTIAANLAISICAYVLTCKLIPGLKEMFLKADIAGIDMNKRSGTRM